LFDADRHRSLADFHSEFQLVKKTGLWTCEPLVNVCCNVHFYIDRGSKYQFNQLA
jgi:hypothetical protein